MREFARRHSLIAMSGGLLVWSLFFLFCYGFLSVGCAVGLESWMLWGWNLIHLILWLAMGITLLVLGLLTYPAWNLVAVGPSSARGRNWDAANEPDQGKGDEPGAVKTERDYFTATVVVLVNVLSGIGVLYVAAPFLMKIPPCIG